MLAKRIVPCLDVKDSMVVKGVRFRQHVVLGNVLDLAQRYRDQGADELVFYDITASAEGRVVSEEWVDRVARVLDIPFCVAGGIRTEHDARRILHAGAEKVSINSPALERPELIAELALAFGSQCVVVGIDSMRQGNDLVCWQYTGSEDTAQASPRRTLEWIAEVTRLGAGEIVLNTMNQDGTGAGYDIAQLRQARAATTLPIVASGGAGRVEHFAAAVTEGRADAALAAGVFHRGELTVADVKAHLAAQGIPVRPVSGEQHA